MAEFTNEVNEISPDEAFVELLAKKIPNDPSHLKLDRVKAGNSKIAMTEISLIDLANREVSLLARDLNRLSPIVKSQSLDAKAVDSISMASHEILYLDVGRWGGPAPKASPIGTRQRNFGLVCGSRAALCEFRPTVSNVPPEQTLILDSVGKTIDTPINTMLTQMRSAGGAVRLLRHGMSSNPNILNGFVPNDTTVHIVLPDFHLPVCTAKPSKTTDDGHHMGRFEYIGSLSVRSDDHGMIKPLLGGPRELGPSALTWFDRYLKGDIFGLPDETAAVDLVAFLDVLESVSLPSPLEKHFVQVGDLYDLWIGLEAFFSQQADHRVVLKNNPGVLAGDFIDEWCRRTERAMMPSSGDPKKNLVTRLNALSFDPAFRSSWLHGNHDNYLLVHTAQKPGGGNMFAPRKALVSEGGIRIEHGQRGDKENRDGETSGQSTTNTVFAHPVVRLLDPNRRSFFYALAAVTYVEKPDFHVFTMGHTHSGFLTKLRLKVTVTG